MQIKNFDGLRAKQVALAFYRGYHKKDRKFINLQYALYFLKKTKNIS